MIKSQELFPHAEPASNVPKGIIGVRIMGEHFWEIKQPRNSGMLRIMYGLTPRLTVMATSGISNHHDRLLPKNIITHTHNGSQIIYYTNPKLYGKKYPYIFGGVNLYAKYRFLSKDGDGKHFRMALYGEYSYLTLAHDESEADLMEDNSGYGGGLIATWLQNKLAVSFTGGVIIPKKYSEQTDLSGGYGTQIVTTEMRYGTNFNYSLSMGYRLMPKKYSNYNETNYNIYVELMGKYFEPTVIYQAGEKVNNTSPMLGRGYYLEAHPGIQKIIRSNTRIDLSFGMPLIKRSYTHFYPFYYIGVQHYFYGK